MSLNMLFFIFCIVAVFIFFVKYIKSLNSIKRIIGIFWLILLVLLLYGMIFVSSAGFEVLFKLGFWKLIAIFVCGILSVFAECYKANISIVYFLAWYFGLPFIYMVVMSHFVLNNTLDYLRIIIYLWFLLCGIVGVSGFVAWIINKRRIFTISTITSALFYASSPLLIVFFGDK